MSRIDRSRGSSKAHAPNPAKTETVTATTMPIHQNHNLRSPFADLRLDLSDTDLRETAYEILVASCRSTVGKPLKYIPQSEKSVDLAQATPPATSLQRSLTSTAASRVKKALGLKSKKRTGGGEHLGQAKVKKVVTIGELIRIQMKISEQTDSRIRRGLLKVAAGQLGRQMESMVLPLEFLQQLKSSDFSNQQEYEIWHRRLLKVLEAGLLLSPRIPLEKSDTAPQRLRQIIHGALEKPIDAGKNRESMQTLRSTVMSLAYRSFDRSASNECHWADGFPLNVRLYQMLLEACFDDNEETSIIEEVDEVLELIKKTWVVLGINQMLHNLCFAWVLFHFYVVTGQYEGDLLFASNNLLMDVENDAKAYKDPVYSKALNSILSSILGWTEKRLLAYHDSFHSDNVEKMQNVVSIAVLSANMLAQDDSRERKKKEVNVSRERVDTYIRSSLRRAFAQKMENVKSSNYDSTDGINRRRPVLSVLAQAVSELAFNEKAMFSPTLRSWQPLAAGIAVATLHSCYGKEWKQFVAGIGDLTPDALEVLNAADKLERDLVQIAVADAGESEDGGKSIIQDMPPYEAEAVISKLVKVWISTRIDRLKEWIDRFLQKEAWSPKANKEQFAPSAVEILRIIDETLEAYFLLPIPLHSRLLHDLMNGLDTCLQQYATKAKSGCGSRTTFIPALPALTRCTMGSKFGVFKKKENSNMVQKRKTQFGTNGDQSWGVPQLCVRINTLHHICSELGVLEKRNIDQLKTSESYVDNITNGSEKWFKLSSASCAEGIKQLSQATAYKVVFQELSHVLWDGLYVGEASTSKIEPFLQDLEQYLEIISSTVHETVRTRVITDVMKASFEGFLLVLLAGGPSRAFTKQDSEIIEQDFKFLSDLFWSNGDGLPADIIEKHSAKAKSILPLFRTDSEILIEQFKRVSVETYGSSAKTRLPLPPTSGQWNPTEPNTLLRVLCYRSDDTAAKFLKKTYNLPRKL